MAATRVVVPGYYLVCYNTSNSIHSRKMVVVPGYYLVCYNKKAASAAASPL